MEGSVHVTSLFYPLRFGSRIYVHTAPAALFRWVMYREQIQLPGDGKFSDAGRDWGQEEKGTTPVPGNLS